MQGWVKSFFSRSRSRSCDHLKKKDLCDPDPLFDVIAIPITLRSLKDFKALSRGYKHVCLHIFNFIPRFKRLVCGSFVFFWQNSAKQKQKQRLIVQ